MGKSIVTEASGGLVGKYSQCACSRYFLCLV